MKASSLLASDFGSEVCFYCGCKCGSSLSTREYVKKTFTGYSTVISPASQYVCNGCALSMQEKTTTTMVDGETRENQRMRSYSWIIKTCEAVAATKAHLTYIRDIMLDPPDPPFAICLADSGQKHLLYRTPINLSRDYYDVMLEEEIIHVSIDDLRDRLELCGRLIAATGRPAIQGKPGQSFLIALQKYYGSETTEQLWARWQPIWCEPISRLAAWLCKSKLEAQNEHQPVNPRGIS